MQEPSVGVPDNPPSFGTCLPEASKPMYFSAEPWGTRIQWPAALERHSHPCVAWANSAAQQQAATSLICHYGVKLHEQLHENSSVPAFWTLTTALDALVWGCKHACKTN